MRNQIAIIDSALRAKYPNSPFDTIKQELIKDESVIIITLNQYKGLLEYRLKHYKPRQAKQRKPIRTELLPDWFEENN